MNRLLFFVLFWLAPILSFSQLSENFSDGLFHGQNRLVEWTGDVNKFIVNESLQLQLNASGTESPAQLKTSSALSTNTQWEWWMKLDFNPTVSNYAKVFLCSDENDLAGDLNGLFVRVGYTGKNVCLVQSQKGKNNKTLIEGITKRLDEASVSLRLKATLDKNGNFYLYSKLDAESDYVLEGNCSISESFECKAFGIACYFTSTRSKLFYFDDFTVQELDNDNPGTEPNPGPDPGDIVINEILYDPPTGGDEYVEIYNNSEKVFDLQFLSFTTRKPSDGSLNKAYPLAASSTLFSPGEYLVITKNRELVCTFFNCRPESLFAELSIMPALANTSGCAVLLDNKTNAVIDEFAYNANMHTAGISSKKGISLERSDFNQPTNDAGNWHSASADSGFGTPGYQNSQSMTGLDGIEDIDLIYPEFGTDNYFVHYRLDKPGYRCRAFVYDAMGRRVNTIADNELLGTEGKLLWNGKGRSSQSLVAGIYIIYVEVYDMDGNVKKFRRPVVVK
ncbi:MAG: lamin tail domain-containing protein [Dysgonamonadaceae bacterium]|jgi:hypothetical protein|nr:lamin tail domain-containing protein [Dysgonamonadaceae bacterium]